jgi:uncharacterized membrane-anchored protein
MLFTAVLIVLAVWRYTTGEIAVDRITTRTNEIFYWVTILVSNTLGTALGDFVATDTGLGFERSALIFAGLIAVVAGAYFFLKIPESVAFWAAYVLTRPLGATLGDTRHSDEAASRGRFGAWENYFFPGDRGSDGYPDCAGGTT